MTRRPLILNATPDAIRSRLRFAEANARHTPRWNLEQTGSSASLHLYGVVGGFWGDIVAADVVREIRGLDVDEIQVYINSPGGDVYDGIAIRNALRQHRANIVVTVDGLAASAASFIACAGDEVVMGAHAEIMIHEAWTIAIGDAEDMRAVAADLDRISDSIAAMYAEKAGGTAESWRALMRVETWYSAEEAVAAGLADRLDDDAERTPAAARFDLSMFAHAGRHSAPAPTTVAALARPAALAPNREEPRMNRAQLLAALNAGTITIEQYTSSLNALDAMEAAGTAAPAAQLAPSAGTPGQPVAAEYAAGPADAPDPAGRTEDRPRSFAQVGADIMAAAERRDLRLVVETVNNALETVGVGNDAADAILRPDWIGEVWQAETEGRPWIESLGGTKPLTSDKIEGFVWALETDDAAFEEDETPANVEIYEGNFAEVPTGTWKLKKVEGDIDQWGFGTKVDRIFQDLGSLDLIGSLFGKLGANYDRISDAHVRTEVLAAATGPVPAETSVLGAVKGIAFDLKRVGAKLDQLWLSENLFDDFADLKVADLPAWLANQMGFVDLRNGNAKVSDSISFEVDFALANGTIVGYDRRAFDVRESSRITLQAIDIAHRATDIGFFAYGGQLANDRRAIRKRTVTLA